jgi:two-component system, cell cycle sensor histidine kinase and response regulator CckA
MTTAERRILVVEDSATQAQRVQLVLEEAGYRVELAVNGVEGVAKVRASPPDMIMSDVVMPEMDGFAFCQAVKSDLALRRIPFALLTGQRSPRDIVRGLEVGADNFITKPFEDSELLARVARIFENLERRRRGGLDLEMTVRVAGREIVVNADREQMIELLFSTSEDLAESNRLLEEVKLQLQEQARELERKVEERTRELRAAEERYRQLVEQAPAVIYRADAKELGRVLYMSPQIEPLLGYPVAAWLADPGLLSRAMHPDDREMAFGQFGRLRRTQPNVGLEFRLLHSDGHVVWVRDEAHLIYSEADDSLSIQGFLVDVTERRQLEERLGQSQKLDAVGRLAGGLAHDFNNLLGVIAGFGELAVRELPPEHSVQGRLAQILRASQRAADLTRQLLAFSRKQVMQPRVLDMGAVLADVEKMLHRLIGEDVVLVVRNAPGLGNVRADPSQVEQVILNLAVNARDAMPRGGTLTLETTNVELDEDYVRRHAGVDAGRYVMLAVSDTGIGMDEGTLARMFEPFFTTKGEGKGTGLGLATVYGIVKQSGGHIWVYSERDHGTTFKIYLPRVDAPADEAPAASARAATPHGTETILLVEDQEALRTMIREILEEQGYTVLEAEGGQAALEIARKHSGRIHLLLTDVVMPRMSGRELAERLAPERPECRALYMSGYSNGAISDRGMLMAGTALLEKPFTSERLGRSVREVLDASPSGPAGSDE